ncbi:variant leucine-rich repeat-containing protein [Microbacterium gorillae]|uniref:variant leucine-rich repeat-containing protein n=1 Tax=Microbacterium gorillae TaxID=1231063 RepID=UPI0005914954|nr:hypothetical protein [Microbacterium gorillae]
MTGPVHDLDRMAAGDPSIDPRRLADIAARRWDLHGIIDANPRAYPGLRKWMADVHRAQATPAAAVQPMAPRPVGAPVAVPPPRRSGLGWVLGGCGCLGVIGVFLVLAVLVGGVGAVTSGSGRQDPPATAPDIQTHLDTIATEAAEYHRLAAQLDGNPVAALVTKPARFAWLEESVADEITYEPVAADLAQKATEYRQELEQRIQEAEGRKANASGTLAESLVDAAGQGFIGIDWDASTQCAKATKPGHTTAGCVSDDPIVVHILPAGTLGGGDWGVRLTVLHELAHLYVRAENDALPPSQYGQATQLVQQGMFEGSSEKFADCYALTYTNGWTLEGGGIISGYGYVCNEKERQAVRAWAAGIGAPMP